MAPYEYSALDESASEIRLMTLLPGRFKDKISIIIETAVLTKEHIPQYEALSYAWGSKENPVDITVTARQLECSKLSSWLGRSRRRRFAARSLGTISVTQNLASALPYLRKKDKPRVFWVDAICVNQQDRAERGHQVKRMAALYSMASQVIVWLGPESQNSTSALRALDGLGSKLWVNWSTRTIISVSTSEIITEAINPSYDYKIWSSVTDLLQRPWFERLWIWQEVRLAKEAYLFCGNEGVPWESFRRAMAYLLRVSKPAEFGQAIEHCYRICDYPDYVTDVVDTLKHMLGSARSASCSDPRDKIYAVLSLAHESETRGLDADYSKPAGAVFQDLVLHYAFNLHSLDILTACELSHNYSFSSLRELSHEYGFLSLRSMPTWVPDWSVPRLSETNIASACCLKSKPRVRYLDGTILAATGVRVAIIKYVGAFSPSRRFDEDVEDDIRALIVPKTLSVNTAERHATVDSLCRTICRNSFAESYAPPDLNLLSFEVCRKYTHRVIDATRYTAIDESLEYRQYLDLVVFAIRGRSYFTTVDGYMGLAPMATYRGDQVCVLLGCQSPLVLRPCGHGIHKVVGECYIDGFMDGAACLGPLPSNWQLVQRYFETHLRHAWAFLDQQTGKFQIEDPRLGPLPAGWRISKHEMQDAYNRYENIETGQRTKFDPRMTPKALMARGVDLREFQLM